MTMQFHSPATLAEAVALKADLGEAAVYLAGGTEVNSSDFPQKPAHVISLAGLTPDTITQARDGITIGAGCTIQELVDAAESPAALQTAASQVAGRNIRNMATIGGHVAGHQPCAELACVLIALGATVDVLDGHTETSVSVEDYLASQPRGLIGHIRIPRQLPARRVVVERYARCAGDVAMVSAAVGLTIESNGIGDPVVAVAGLGPSVVRLAATEALLCGELPVREELERCVAGEISPRDDWRGGAAFKRRLTVAIVASAVNAAAQAERAQT